MISALSRMRTPAHAHVYACILFCVFKCVWVCLCICVFVVHLCMCDTENLTLEYDTNLSVRVGVYVQAIECVFLCR